MTLIKHLRRVLALCLLFGMVGWAHAGLITYDYKTTLSLSSGTDALGLNGATIEIKVDVNSNAVYITRFGIPAVVMNNDGTLTVSGSSLAANNATFVIAQMAFYPGFAGLFTDPAGVDPVVPLAVGGSLTLVDNTVATAHGATAVSGGTVSLSDFVPATSTGGQFFGSNGSAYNQVNTVITAALTSGTTVPEPATLGLLSLGLAGFAFAQRRRRS